MTPIKSTIKPITVLAASALENPWKKLHNAHAAFRDKSHYLKQVFFFFLKNDGLLHFRFLTVCTEFFSFDDGQEHIAP